VGHADARGRRAATDRSQNAKACGTDIISYLSEGFGVNTFAREGNTVYRCDSSSARGVEFLMGYYPILDRMPKGRNEGNAFQTWLRRHDEYDCESCARTPALVVEEA